MLEETNSAGFCTPSLFYGVTKVVTLCVSLSLLDIIDD